MPADAHTCSDAARIAGQRDELRLHWKALTKCCDFLALGSSTDLIRMWDGRPTQTLDNLASLWNLAESDEDTTALLQLGAAWVAHESVLQLPQQKERWSERLRIGFLTTVFDARMRRLLAPVLNELACFHDVVLVLLASTPSDGAQERWGDLFIDSRTPTCGQLASIHGADLDVLIDLNGLQQIGSAAGLLVSRPARCCIIWTGRPMPVPSRLADWQIVDPYLVPAISLDDQAAPLILPESWAFLGEVPEKVVPCRRHGASTRICCPSPPSYVRPDAIKAWVTILASATGVTLVFTHTSFAHPQARDNLERVFCAAGGKSTQIAFEIDPLGLDWGTFAFVVATYPVMGPLTLVEALSAGVPVVARSGPWQPQRMASSILHNAKAGQLIGRDWDHYIEIARELLRAPIDDTARSYLRLALSKSATCNASRFACQFRQAIEKVAYGAPFSYQNPTMPGPNCVEVGSPYTTWQP